jgi:hypothetical protein
VTRSDGERIADILDAAGELAEIVGRGRLSFDDDIAVRGRSNACWRSSAKRRTGSLTR